MSNGIRSIKYKGYSFDILFLHSTLILFLSFEHHHTSLKFGNIKQIPDVALDVSLLDIVFA